MVLLGVWDDKVELGAGIKFAGQTLIALLVAAAGVRITVFVPSVAFSYAITVLWILTVINAFNFMDNMNGLCPGLGAIGAAGFAIIAAGHGQYLVALLALLACGALLGFLPYNYPRATAFLGDAGSHLVGYLLAVLAILPHFYSAKHPQPLAILSPLLVLAVPLADMAWVVVLRTRMETVLHRRHKPSLASAGAPRAEQSGRRGGDLGAGGGDRGGGGGAELVNNVSRIRAQ